MRCDSHVHVIGSLERYPQLASRKYLAGLAKLSDLRRLGTSRGISRFVIVQPSFYGTDNTLLLESLDELGAHGRGVVVADTAGVERTVLADWSRRGVRGLRINHYSTLGQPKPFMDEFAALVPVARAMNWHIEIIVPIDSIAAHAAPIVAAPVTVVIDHYGLYGEHRPGSAPGQALLDLLRYPHVWIKLSAPYRVSRNPLETRPDKAWLSAVLAVAGDRCVWGSDWPGTPPHEAQYGPDIVSPYRKLSYQALVDDFLSAVASPAQSDRIMQANPARLYGYADTA